MTKARLLGAAAMAACLYATASLAQDAPLRIVLPSEPADIDACNTTVSNIGIIIKENIVETLTTLNGETSAVEPRLATGWTDQGNGTWRVTLREGVTFHDGAAFNAQAVVKAIDRLESEAIACRDRTKISRDRPDDRRGRRSDHRHHRQPAAGADADTAQLHRGRLARHAG